MGDAAEAAAESQVAVLPPHDMLMWIGGVVYVSSHNESANSPLYG